MAAAAAAGTYGMKGATTADPPGASRRRAFSIAVTLLTVRVTQGLR